MPSISLVLLLSRVRSVCIHNVDIPELSSFGIRFGEDCFKYTYSLQSSSTHSPLFLSLDADALETAIKRVGSYLDTAYE